VGGNFSNASQEVSSHDPGHSRQREVCVVAQGVGVSAERKIGHDAAVLVRQRGGDRAPQVAVHPDAVHEHDRRAAAALPVLDRAGRPAVRRSPSSGLIAI
jgi:hypothetical protein